MRPAVTVASAVLLALGAAVLGLFLWLRTYAPLAATRPITPGPGLGADVEPTFGSGGKTVLIPAYRAGRPFDATFTLHNDGRFAVTILDLVPAAGALAAASVPDPPLPLRLAPQDTALLTVRWRLACRRGGGEISSDRVRLRYRYLSLFTRTATVELPFAVTLRCSGGPPASP